MTLSTALAALIFLTRMCTSPAQRLVSELLTRGRVCFVGLSCCFVKRPSIVRAGAKLNQRDASELLSGRLDSRIGTVTDCIRSLHSKVRSISGSKEPIRKLKICTCDGAWVQRSFEMQISQVLLMYSLLSAAAASLDEDIQEGKRHPAPTRYPRLLGANVSGSLHCGGVRWGYTVECSGRLQSWARLLCTTGITGCRNCQLDAAIQASSGRVSRNVNVRQARFLAAAWVFCGSEA